MPAPCRPFERTPRGGLAGRSPCNMQPCRQRPSASGLGVSVPRVCAWHPTEAGASGLLPPRHPCASPVCVQSIVLLHSEQGCAVCSPLVAHVPCGAPIHAILCLAAVACWAAARVQFLLGCGNRQVPACTDMLLVAAYSLCRLAVDLDISLAMGLTLHTAWWLQLHTPTHAESSTQTATIPHRGRIPCSS